MMTSEHERARSWREARGLSRDQLADATGYAPVTVYWMEQGLSPPRPGKKSRAVKPWVFQRFKMACAGVEYRLRAGKPFNWGS